MTPVNEIYDIFLSQIDDEMFALLRRDVIRRELHKYLISSISKFRDCKQDLTILDYSIIDNISFRLGEIETDIPKDRPKNIEVVGLDTGIEYRKDIDWKLTDNKITLTFPAKEEIAVFMYDNGYIEADLTNREILILSLGMVYYWLHPKRNREENLKQVLTDDAYKRLSGANMLDKMLKLYNQTQREWELELIEYTYDDMKALN